MKRKTKDIFEDWRKKFLNESAPYGVGTNVPTMAGYSGTASGTEISPYTADVEPTAEQDSDQVVKAVLERNGQVILLKNDKGWDLPGGHKKVSEDPVTAIEREVYEETMMQITDIVELTSGTLSKVNELKANKNIKLKISIGKIRRGGVKDVDTSKIITLFFGGKYLKDDVTLSDEHTEYDFFSLEKINQMPEAGPDGLSREYKDAINAYFKYTQDLPL